MTVLASGRILDLVPIFRASLTQDGILVFHDDGNLSLTVDTGFSGGIALPQELIDRMNVELIAHEVFRLATGEEVEFPVFWGEVMTGNQRTETWFIPGDLLLGMELLSSVGFELLLGFSREEVSLVG